MEQLNREGVALAYEEVGLGEPPLLFVHCWCGDHTFFAGQVEHFRRSHRVVAVDLRGHGASDKPQIAWALANLHETSAFDEVMKEYRVGHLSKVQRLDGNQHGRIPGRSDLIAIHLQSLPERIQQQSHYARLDEVSSPGRAARQPRPSK